MSSIWTKGPAYTCGMALLDLSVEQGVRGVQHFIDHLFSRDLVGNLILIALRSLQIESGCGFHLLENPSEWVPCPHGLLVDNDTRLHCKEQDYAQGGASPSGAN
jgi:hypothetical protein